MAAPAESHAPRRRLVFAALIAAIAVAAILAVLLPGLRQKRLIDEIEAHGGRVYLKTIFPEWLDRALTRVLDDRHNRMFGRYERVRVVGAWFDDPRMAEARGFPGARGIRLKNTALSSSGLGWLARADELVRLSLQDPAIDGDWMSDMPAIPRLKSLTIIQLRTAETIDPLPHRFPNLEDLRLLDCRVDAGDLKHVASLPKLVYLCLDRSDIEAAGFVHLAGHSRLEILALEESSVGDDGMRHLAKCPKLETLWLQGASVTDQGVVDLAGAPSLSTLDLSRTTVTTAGIHGLADLPSLSVLGLSDTLVTDDVVPVLLWMPELKYVNLGSSPVSPEARERLERELEQRR